MVTLPFETRLAAEATDAVSGLEVVAAETLVADVPDEVPDPDVAGFV
jgi:hypothetical protein